MKIDIRFNIIGKPLFEKYGRFQGHIIAVEYGTKGEIKHVIYENSGVIVKTDVSSLKIEDDKITVSSPILITAENLHTELSLFKLQQEAMNVEAEKMQQDKFKSANIVNEIKSELENAYNDVSKRTEEVIMRLNNRANWVEDRQNWIYRLFLNLKVIKQLGFVNDNSHSVSYEKLEKELFITIDEADDVNRILVDITSLITRIKDLNEKQHVQETEGLDVETNSNHNDLESHEIDSSSNNNEISNNIETQVTTA